MNRKKTNKCLYQSVTHKDECYCQSICFTDGRLVLYTIYTCVILLFQGGIYILQIVDWYCTLFSVMLVCILECITIGWIYGTYYINDGCLISSRNLIFASIWVHLLYFGGVPVAHVFGFLCLCYVFCFVCLRSVYCIQCLQLPIPGCPVGFL